MQDRFFAQVVLDDCRHVGVHRLVIGDAGAYGVRQGHVAGAVSVERPGTPRLESGAERQRIEKIVVHPAIDDVDPAQARGCPHVDDVVVHQQVASFDQLDAHLLGQERVLEIGGVEDARREKDMVGSLVRCDYGRERPQGGQQRLAVVVDRN